MKRTRTTRRSHRRPGRGRSKIRKVMREYKHGSLRSSRGGKVRSRKQAVAIALSEARAAGARIPKRRRRRS
ncbi:MAG TPA: DUF6496 domain-containing protein [Methylomirabilota bacterium]|nr:DUF6496 domain-containing protein [Methylomirabilota bacterium]